MKLLTVEEFEEALEEAYQKPTYGGMWGAKRKQQVLATIKVACERIAAMQSCISCRGLGERHWRSQHDSADVKVFDCPDCKDHPGFAYEDWKTALRSLEEK